jgi:predicted DNA-binding protein
MLAIRLPQSIEKRLERLAMRRGRTKIYYVREAIREHLKDLEDLCLAEGALERVRSAKERTTPLMGQEVRALDPGVQISRSGALEGSLGEFYRGPLFQLVTLAGFAGIGLVLVVTGTFSVMAYNVSLRTREIGVRMALGAQQASILRLVLLNGSRLVAAGIPAGLVLSYALTRLPPAKFPTCLRQTHGPSPRS